MTDLTKNSTRTQEERGTVHPILFQPPMVRALLAGTKTQTRRLLKPQPPSDSGPLTWTAYHPTKVDRRGEEYPGPLTFGASSEDGSFATPIRIRPGDRLWVRENVQAVIDAEEHDAIRYLADGHIERSRAETAAEAERYAQQLYCYRRRKGAPNRMTGVPVPSIHMPRWASRLTLTVTDVRVQRLQDISEWDARAEGAYVGKVSGRVADDQVTMVVAGVWFSTARGWYADLWDRINGTGSWDTNPWVVAYSFAVERRNIDAAP